MDHVEFSLGLRYRNAGTKAAGNQQPACKGFLPALWTGLETVEGVQRNPKVARATGVDSGKFRRRNPDYSERELVNQNGLTDDCGGGGEAAAPVAIAQHGDIRALAIVTRAEEPAALWRDSENGEEII